MWYRVSLIDFVQNYLPPKAEFITLEKPYKKPAVFMVDLDGDGILEIIAAYKWQGENYTIIMKNYNNIWYVVDNIRRRSPSRRKNRAVKLHLAPVKLANGVKWGYIDNKGDFAIKPKYDFAYSFGENGIAIVKEKNFYGIVDQLGRYVLQPKYDSIDEFSEGRAAAVYKDIFKVIDESGKELTNKPYTFIGRFKEGRATASVTDMQGKSLYGYLDREGNEAVPLKYEYVGDYNNGKAVVKISDNQYALIGLNGQILKIYRYAFVGEIGDGLLAFKQSDDGKFGYMDVDGNIVIQPKYTAAQSFSKGRAIVNISESYSNGYGLIDEKGNYIMMPQYNDINLLGDNRVAVGRAIDKDQPYLGSKFAIADTDGKFLTDFIYNGVLNYKDGFASAFNDKYTFFIDKNGKVAKNLPMVSGSGTLYFEGDLIKADVDHRVSYLDKVGNIVWKQDTIIPLNNQYFVKEEKYKSNKDYLVYYPQIQGIKDINAQNSANNKLKELSQVKPIDSNVQLDYNYFGDFSIELFKKNLLIMELWGYNYPFGAAHGMPTRSYAHVDLESGKLYELKDFFKKNSNYVKVLSDIIEKQIKNNEEYSYVWLDSYKGIKEDQPFYVTEDALYIYFYPYDIAPYAAGFPTFKIPFEDIISIIDVNGEFWRAFN
jgi:Protein of unknown function (DUF3298)./KWG Leptospira.